MTWLLAVYSVVSRAACAARAALYRRAWKKPLRSPLPVISVGNLALGGFGKTPLVMELIAWAQARGWKPALVSRGYRGLWEKEGGVLSDGRSLKAGWREGGDEPAMVAKRFPAAGVFVGRHRFRSCLEAQKAGFETIILDDGFQHLKLARDLDIVLHGPGAGALREGTRALRRAGILLADEQAGADWASGLGRRFPGLAVFSYRVRPRDVFDLGTGRAAPLESLRGRDAVAFCGIARPERFFNLLEKLGLRVIEKLAFPDHYEYLPSAIDRIGEAYQRHWPGVLITTEKDMVKLEASAERFKPVPVLVLRVGLELPAAFFDRLSPYFNPARSRHA